MVSVNLDQGHEGGSASPVHRRDADHRDGSEYNHMTRNHGFGSRRDTGRYPDPLPHCGRGRVGVRPIGRAFDRPSFVRGPVRGDGISRNNPYVGPRVGDWIGPDPICGNRNFARRVYCNCCNRPRYAPDRRHHGRYGFSNERKGFERRPLSPPHRGPLARDATCEGEKPISTKKSCPATKRQSP